MTEPTPPAPMKRRSGWRMLGLIVSGMLLLVIGVGLWWYHDDGDVEAIRAKAREQGRPLAWSDLGLVPSPAERLRQWRRVETLSQGLSAFQNKPGPDGKFFRVWDPIPEAMRAHHAALDPAAITELAELLDRLGDQPLVLRDRISFTQVMPEIEVARRLIRFLQERLILAEPREAGAWARRMLATCRRFAVDGLMSHLVRTSLLDATLSGIAFRLADLKQSDPTIGAEILATLESHHDNLLRALDGEFLMTLEAVAGPLDNRYFYSDYHDWTEQWYMPLVVRAGRHGLLDSCLEATVELRRQEPDAMLAWASAMDAKVHAARGGIPYPSLILGGLFMPAWSVVVRQGELTVLRGRLTAAELQDGPWPIDVFDPGRAPLRAMRRDGRVIAAYSVHTDGIDQGGDEKADRVFPLYARP